MKRTILTIVLAASALVQGAPVHPAAIDVDKTTVCEIVNHPARYIGKTVEVRAQIWPDDRRRDLFWMNESSIRIDKVCRFLQATFRVDAGFSLQTAFGTFRGQIARKLSHQPSILWGPKAEGLGITFIVDQTSDIYLRRDYLSGPVPRLQLYDRDAAAFVGPDE